MGESHLINCVGKLPIQVLTPDLPFLIAISVKYYFKSPLQSSNDVSGLRVQGCVLALDGDTVFAQFRIGREGKDERPTFHASLKLPCIQSFFQATWGKLEGANVISQKSLVVQPAKRANPAVRRLRDLLLRHINVFNEDRLGNQPSPGTSPGALGLTPERPGEGILFLPFRPSHFQKS